MKRFFTLVLAVLLVLPFILVPALAAPVGDGVTESSGHGYALYNGYKFSTNFDNWVNAGFDSTSYPYVIYGYGYYSLQYRVVAVFSDYPLGYILDSEEVFPREDTPSEARFVCFTYAAVPNEYGYHWVVPNDEGLLVDLPVAISQLYWSNYNLIDPFDIDNPTVTFYKSDPIPLDGMTVIEWDGTVTNHNYLADHLWRVSDLTPSLNQLTGGYSVFKSVSTGQLTVATLNVGSTLTQEDGYIYFTGGGVYPNASSPGIYFHKNYSDPVAEQVQTQLLAFSATEGGGGGVQPDPSDPTDPSVPDDPTDPTVSVDEKLDQIQQDQVVIQDTLDQIQSDQIITNDKLDQIDQNQGITNDKLDDIIDGTVTPDIPSGGDIITDNDDLESQIKEDITPGIDSIGDWFTDSLETFEEYFGVFIIIIWLFDKIVDIGFFKPLLAIALSLGVVCSILGIGMTIANKPKRGD